MAINSSVGIMGSVGRGGRNDTLDVTNIQERLNDLMHHPRIELDVDGDSGPLTRAMIADFQRSVLEHKWPDARVDPGGNTIAALNDPNSKSVWARMSIPPDIPKPAPTPKKPEKPKGPVRPAVHPSFNSRPLTREAAIKIGTGGFVSMPDPSSPGGTAFFKAGEIWEMPEGRRLIIQAHEWAERKDEKVSLVGVVYYLQLTADTAIAQTGTMYVQSRAGFVSDFHHTPIAKAGKSLKATLVVIEAEMAFLQGAVRMSGVVAAIDYGLTGVEWIAKNKKNFKKWTTAVTLLLEARAILKKYCPTLWDKIIDAALLGAWRGSKAIVYMYGTDIAGNVPEAMIKDPVKVAKSAGVLIGKLGKGALNGKTGALKVVFTVLLGVVMHAVKSVPAAAKITYADEKKAAAEIVAALRKTGVALSEGDSLTVVKEVVTHADEVAAAMKKLKTGFDALTT